MSYSVGAQYCVYEDSGSLVESIRRIYHLMDKITILLNYDPWCGRENLLGSFDTYRKIKEFPDPDNKIILISQHWATEAIQRNWGKDLLNKMGLKWMLLIDDDELYNPNELENALKYIQTSQAYAFQVAMQIYWKSVDYCIENLTYAMPTLMLTDMSKVYFGYCRNIKVVDGTWENLQPQTIVNHHLSYVRTNQQLLRKIETFSHADEKRTDGKDVKKLWLDWYNNVWLKWTPAMENLHVNPDQPESFSKAVEAKNSSYKLLPFV